MEILAWIAFVTSIIVTLIGDNTAAIHFNTLATFFMIVALKNNNDKNNSNKT